jgi:hypothetical protein|tara:strand:- start:767 stop:1102 length:336 start_codon:yes stop_codon:yes gene_type:complete
MENAQRVFGFMLVILGCALGFVGWPALYYQQNESLKDEVESLKAERVELRNAADEVESLKAERVELRKAVTASHEQVQNAGGALTLVYKMIQESGDTTLVNDFESLLKKEQ